MITAVGVSPVLECNAGSARTRHDNVALGVVAGQKKNGGE